MDVICTNKILEHKGCANPETEEKIPGFDFKHQLQYFKKDFSKQLSGFGTSQFQMSNQLLKIYKNILDNLGIKKKKPQHDTNVVITKTYMLVIVRNIFAHTDLRKDKDLPPYRPNTLCFLGLFYTRSEEQTKNSTKKGFMNILEQCCEKESEALESTQKFKED